MLGPNSRLPALLSLVASALGLSFAWTSTADYAQHLDRRLHDLHCSVIPGAPPTSEAEACRAAMYSPYSALFKQDYWGGIPISLFALGAFSFFAGFALYLLLAGRNAPRKAVVLHAVVGVTPLIVSLVMLGISASKLGSFCKTCVGIYVASFVLATGALSGLWTLREAAFDAPEPRPAGGWRAPLGLLVGLALATLTPALVYARALPDHRPHLESCGKLQKTTEPNGALLRMATARSRQPAVLFEDPLCPTCKAFHERTLAEDVFDRLDAQLVLFPLDSECNWMLGEPLHPGACIVSRAVLCAGDRARQVLEWAYENQPELARAGKAGKAPLLEAIERRWGKDLVACLDSREARLRLNRHLHFASDNSVPVSTPQIYLGDRRLCDEDTDIGLRYTLAQLAPEVVR
jgi:uncharacterized membrane protein